MIVKIIPWYFCFWTTTIVADKEEKEGEEGEDDEDDEEKKK